MNELLQKAYDCYLVYLDNLNYGNVTQNDCLLYDAILTIANNIQEERYIQYFVANLFCGDKYPLTITSDMDRLIAWTLNEEETVDNLFDWHELEAPTNTTYRVTTNSEIGFRFFYLSIPQGVNVTIMNELDMVLYDSTLPANNVNQVFSLSGTMVMEGGQINNIYRKDDIYNATNSILFKVKIY